MGIVHSWGRSVHRMARKSCATIKHHNAAFHCFECSTLCLCELWSAAALHMRRFGAKCLQLDRCPNRLCAWQFLFWLGVCI